SAAHWFEAALRLLPDDVAAAERVELMVAHADALAGAGHFAQRHRALLESLELAPADAVALRVRVTTLCAGVEHLLGRHVQAHARLEDALADVGDRNSQEACALMIELAVDALYRSAFDEMRSWAACAVEAESGDRALAAAALAVRALAAAYS